MSELREKVAYIVAEIDANQDLAAELAIADRILAIPEIAEALAYHQGKALRTIMGGKLIGEL